MKTAVTALHALADETRWRMAMLLSGRALCVCELADILDMPQSSVSSHLQVIKKGGLLDSEQCGKWIYYRISRNHETLLLTLSRFFGLSPETDPTLRLDAAKTVRRLAERETSCCPLPRELDEPEKPTLKKRPSLSL